MMIPVTAITNSTVAGMQVYIPLQLRVKQYPDGQYLFVRRCLEYPYARVYLLVPDISPPLEGDYRSSGESGIVGEVKNESYIAFWLKELKTTGAIFFKLLIRYQKPIVI